MKKLILILTLAVAALSFAAAKANPPGCATCGNGGGAGAGWQGGGYGGHSGHAHKYDRFTGWFRGAQHYKPQPAPWYLYWPYNGQFMTPFPVGGGGAPGTGGLVNPYFPAGQ